MAAIHNGWRVWVGIRLFIRKFEIEEFAQLMHIVDGFVIKTSPLFDRIRTDDETSMRDSVVEAVKSFVDDYGGLEMWLRVLNSVEGAKYFDCYLQSMKRI